MPTDVTPAQRAEALKLGLRYARLRLASVPQASLAARHIKMHIAIIEAAIGPPTTVPRAVEGGGWDDMGRSVDE